jgi:hypothetical protein
MFAAAGRFGLVSARARAMGVVIVHARRKSGGYHHVGDDRGNKDYLSKLR